jgi:mono/diheme cytochrome c family protein
MREDDTRRAAESFARIHFEGNFLACEASIRFVGRALGIVACLCSLPALAGAGLRLHDKFRAPPPLPPLHVEIARGPSDGRSSPVVLARAGKRDVVLVADADANEVDAFDASNGHLLARQIVSGGPSQLLLDANAHVWVTARDANVVREFDLQAKALFPERERTEDGASRKLLSLRREIETDVEPVAMALEQPPSNVRGADGPRDTILVATGWGHSLAAFDVETGARAFRVELPREPRSIAIAQRRAFVSHAAGSLVSVVPLGGDHTPQKIELRGEEGTMVGARGLTDRMSFGHAQLGQSLGGLGGLDPNDDRFGFGSFSNAFDTPPLLKKPGPRSAAQGFAIVASTASGRERILLPEVLAQPGEMPDIKQGEPRPTGYGSFGASPMMRAFGTETAHVAVIDPGRTTTTSESMKLTIDDRQCLLPRAATIDPSRGTLLVACLGHDLVAEFDASGDSKVEKLVATWAVPSGPTGIAVDAERLYVWSSFDHVLTIADRTSDVGGSVPRAAIFASATKERVATPFEVGQKIFHASGSLALSRDGRACASCHPDGRDDGLTWASPDGPRQTPMLAGRLRESAPFGWTDGSKTVHDHLQKTLKRLEGQGMDEESAYGLMTYLERMRSPMRPTATATATTTATSTSTLARGKTLFESYEVGCSSCHESKQHLPTGDGETHDIGSGAKGDAILAFATPSLRFVGGTAPYFHDGRYATLRELLHDTDGRMGDTGQLSPEDLDALTAYVESL